MKYRICCMTWLQSLDWRRNVLEWAVGNISTVLRIELVIYSSIFTLYVVNFIELVFFIVMHVALRAPKEKPFYIDGENVVPAVHAVIDRVSTPTLIFYHY